MVLTGATGPAGCIGAHAPRRPPSEVNVVDLVTGGEPVKAAELHCDPLLAVDS
jgi:hypothetical protein